MHVYSTSLVCIHVHKCALTHPCIYTYMQIQHTHSCIYIRVWSRFQCNLAFSVIAHAYVYILCIIIYIHLCVIAFIYIWIRQMYTHTFSHAYILCIIVYMYAFCVLSYTYVYILCIIIHMYHRMHKHMNATNVFIYIFGDKCIHMHFVYYHIYHCMHIHMNAIINKCTYWNVLSVISHAV